MDPQTRAACLNIIAAFTGARDVAKPTREALSCIGVPNGQADVAVLTGGAILAGTDCMAAAIQSSVASTYALVGGAGHTTATFRARVHELWPAACFADDASEAEVFNAYLQSRYGLTADLLETRSTNSGQNVTYLFELLRARGIEPQTMLVIQDATMQRRMCAGIQLLEPQVRLVSYAAYQAHVVVHDGELTYKEPVPFGMWDIDRYQTLLMGEVARLRDAPGGYGPKGQGLIAHVDVPDEVIAAFEQLRAAYPNSVRVAIPAA